MATKETFQEAFLKSMSVNAVVLKACECGQVQYGWNICPQCGKENVVVDLGVVSYYHRNPLRRFWFWIKKVFRETFLRRT